MAIKFEVVGAASPKEAPVRLELVPDEEGDVQLLANGEVLLWIMQNGIVCTSCDSPEHFSSLGFQINEDDEVVVE